MKYLQEDIERSIQARVDAVLWSINNLDTDREQKILHFGEIPNESIDRLADKNVWVERGESLTHPYAYVITWSF
jgi:hypothetical protein